LGGGEGELKVLLNLSGTGEVKNLGEPKVVAIHCWMGVEKFEVRGRGGG